MGRAWSCYNYIGASCVHLHGDSSKRKAGCYASATYLSLLSTFRCSVAIPTRSLAFSCLSLFNFGWQSPLLCWPLCSKFYGAGNYFSDMVNSVGHVENFATFARIYSQWRSYIPTENWGLYSCAVVWLKLFNAQALLPEHQTYYTAYHA